MKKSNKVLLIILVILILVGIGIGLATVGANPNEEAKIIKDSLVTLSTVEAGNGFEDLKGLKDILKDKQIVALGGSTYGTKEFFQMKQRILEFLVEEMGYRTFAIDVDFGRTEVINNYILNGEGDVEDIVRQTKINNNFLSWSTEESVELIEWMKKYNEDSSHERKIKFYGIRMIDAKESPNFVLEYLKNLDQNLYTEFKENLKRVKSENIYSIPTSELRKEQEN